LTVVTGQFICTINRTNLTKTVKHLVFRMQQNHLYTSEISDLPF